VPKEAVRREETLKMYNAVKESLSIISEVSMNTVSTPIPPPVVATDDDQLTDSGSDL
jgi:hypothetical protein